LDIVHGNADVSSQKPTLYQERFASLRLKRRIRNFPCKAAEITSAALFSQLVDQLRDQPTLMWRQFLDSGSQFKRFARWFDGFPGQIRLCCLG
jgi:hypothetical protein